MAQAKAAEEAASELQKKAIKGARQEQIQTTYEWQKRVLGSRDCGQKKSYLPEVR